MSVSGHKEESDEAAACHPAVRAAAVKETRRKLDRVIPNTKRHTVTICETV